MKDDIKPDIKIIQVENLLLHERNDPRRVKRLAQQIKNDGFLNDPPVVARVRGMCPRIVLDGANRVSAWRENGWEDILVQEVKYREPFVKLAGWAHLIDYPGDLISQIRQLGQVEIDQIDSEVRADFFTGKSLVWLETPQGGCYLIKGTGNLLDEISTILKISDLYRGKVDIERVPDDQSPIAEKKGNRFFLLYRRFTPKEIKKIVRKGFYVPSGITRHIIPYRYENLRFPLDILTKKKTLVWKNEKLSYFMTKIEGQEIIKGKNE